jgi:hypothetical protein
VPDEQIAAWPELLVKFPHQRLLGLFVKIDNHVSAKDNIHFSRNPKIIVHEVDPPE